MDAAEDKVVKLTKDTKYSITQMNGQRKYGGPPPNWTGGRPPKGTEIFVSKIPRDCLEDELVPVFSKPGQIYVLRLMMDFSGTNRGFCFVQYATLAETKLAIEMLDGYEIRPGQSLKVSKSVDNCRLFMGQIPKDITREDILNTINNYVDGVTDVILYLSCTDKHLNRGFCFVEFDSHRSAAIARRFFVTSGIRLWGCLTRVDWAVPESDIDDDIMSKVTVMYVRNLLLKTSEAELKAAITEFVNENEIIRLRKVRDFAFVHFNSREAAAKAIEGMSGYVMEDATLSASWARPAVLAKQKKNALSRNINQTCIFDEQQGIYWKPEASPDIVMPENNWFMYQNINQHPSYITEPIYPPNNEKVTTMLPLPPNDINCFNFETQNFDIKNYIYAMIMTTRPAVVLQNVARIKQWGIVSYQVTFVSPTPTYIFAHFQATVIITKGDNMVAYPHITHVPAKTAELAKDLVAEAFLNTYIF